MLGRRIKIDRKLEVKIEIEKIWRIRTEGRGEKGGDNNSKTKKIEDR